MLRVIQEAFYYEMLQYDEGFQDDWKMTDFQPLEYRNQFGVVDAGIPTVGAKMYHQKSDNNEIKCEE